MSPHIHIGPAEILVTFAGVLIVGTAWRFAAMKMGDKPLARAMLFAY